MYKMSTSSTYSKSEHNHSTEELLDDNEDDKHMNDQTGTTADVSISNTLPSDKELKEKKLIDSYEDFDFVDEKLDMNGECDDNSDDDGDDDDNKLADKKSETCDGNDIIIAEHVPKLNKLPPYVKLIENGNDLIDEKLTSNGVNNHEHNSASDSDNIARNGSNFPNTKDELNETTNTFEDKTNNGSDANNGTATTSDLENKHLDIVLTKDKSSDNVHNDLDTLDGCWIERVTFIHDDVDARYEPAIDPGVDTPRTHWEQVKYIFNILFASVSPLVSVGIFIYDIVGDIELAIHYKTAGEVTYFWLTVACIVVPAILMSIVDLVWVIMGKKLTGSRYECRDIVRIIIGGLSLGRFVRACICAAHTIQGLRKPHKKTLLEIKADIKKFDESLLNFISAFTEDIVMLNAQLYLFFTGRVELDVSFHSLMGSFLGISWTYATLYRDGRKAKRQSSNLRIFGCAFFFVAALAVLVARSFSIVFFIIYVKVWISVILLSLHFIAMYIWLWRQQKSDVTDKKQTCVKRLYLLFFAYVSIYNFVNVKNGSAFTRMVIFYVILYTECAIMAAVAFSSIQHAGDGKSSYYLISLPAGILVHVLFQGLYYRCFHANFAPTSKYDIDI